MENNTKNEIINYQPTQKEMKDILISKIRHYKNIDIKIKEVTNAVGIFYGITAYIKLDEISNGIFHSATLKTVSYNKRTVNIKCVFSDNENLIHDMEINRDSVFQCFRDIAPDTITNISLEKFKDQSDKSHVRIIASTIKGSSLIYVYKRLMDFVNIINEKYGNLITTPNKDLSQLLPNESVSLANTVAEINKSIINSNIIENKLNDTKSEDKKKIETQSNEKKSEDKYISSNFTLSSQIIKDLEAEEIRLQEIIDNIKLLKQTHKKYLENNSITKIPTVIPNVIPTVITTNTIIEDSTLPPTFASKVKNSLKM